jgi:hypothetical protein
MARLSKAAIDIANHIGCDADDMEDYRYQATRTNRPVYSFDADYWSAGGAKPPTHQDGWDMEWEKVVSSYDGKTVLWHARST